RTQRSSFTPIRLPFSQSPPSRWRCCSRPPSYDTRCCRHAAKGGADGPPASLQFEGRPRVLGSRAEAKTRLLGAGGGGSVRVDRTCDHTPRTHGGAGGL